MDDRRPWNASQKRATFELKPKFENYQVKRWDAGMVRTVNVLDRGRENSKAKRWKD